MLNIHALNELKRTVKGIRTVKGGYFAVVELPHQRSPSPQKNPLKLQDWQDFVECYNPQQA